MLTIGLTGGIGSGKSTIAHIFSTLDVPVIDADILAKELLETKTIYIRKVITHFGSDILDATSQLDRTKLRQLIFTDPAARTWLEKLLHPPILRSIKKQLRTLAAQNTPYCVVVIPLLTEIKKAQSLVDHILVVDVTEKTQIARTTKRDELSPDNVKKILRIQASRAARLAIADEIIENESDKEALVLKVQGLHAHYTDLATHSYFA